MSTIVSYAIELIASKIARHNILLIAPGKTAVSKQEVIKQYIIQKMPIVISINFLHDEINSDYVYMSNVKRYDYWKHIDRFKKQSKLITSNIKQQADDDTEIIISFNKLIKCGWEHIDNSTIMLLRLLDLFDITSIALAGFDGFCYGEESKYNYATIDLELSKVRENPIKLNEEIVSMLKDYIATRTKSTPISFITESRFSSILESTEDG